MWHVVSIPTLVPFLRQQLFRRRATSSSCGGRAAPALDQTAETVRTFTSFVDPLLYEANYMTKAAKKADSPSLRTTFHIKRATDWFRKLEWEHEQLQQTGFLGGEELRYRLINFCITAWSLVDWIHRDLSTQVKQVSLPEYRAQIKAESDVMDACRHIADACKHAGIDFNVDDGIRTDYDELFVGFFDQSSGKSAPLFCHEVMAYVARKVAPIR